MRDSLRTAKVGLLVVVGLVAAFAIYRYVEERASGGDGYRVYALFDDARGLVPKSRVVIAGIPVGIIDRITLDGTMARVDIVINDGVALHRDASVAMRTESLLGEKILILNPGTMTLTTAGDPVVPLMEEGGRITVAASSPGMDELMAQMSRVLENVQGVTQQLNRSFGTDAAGAQMSAALQSLSEALEAVNRTIQSNEEAIHHTLENIDRTTTAAQPHVAEILEHVESATRNVAELLSERRPDLDRATGELDDTIASIHSAADELNGVLEDTHDVTGRVARGEGTIGRLTSDETLIDEVEGAAEGVNTLVGGLARLRTVVELRSEYNFFASTFKTYFSIRLIPREDRYFLVQLIDDPRGFRSVTRTTVQRTPPAPGEAYQYTEQRSTVTEKLRFSIMLAKRIGFATFRFGLLESTGGLGVDLHVFEDRLELTTDVFDIGEQIFPRLRLRAAFEVVSRVWILGGVDDALNDSNDFFLGLMLRFDDQDLKTILPFVGGISGGL
ncbi:MAG: MCE family protein [Deltaproteobacteria bacterium]|nr:MCE family protein [Deltaproteobacteria bacterium]